MAEPLAIEGTSTKPFKKMKGTSGESIITGEEHPQSSAGGTYHKPSAGSDKGKQPTPDLDSTPVKYGQLSQSLNERYKKWLKEENILGWRRVPSEFKTRIKDIVLDLSVLRDAIKDVMTSVLVWRMTEDGGYTDEEVTTLSGSIAKSVSEAFMTAMYAKLRFIHNQSRTHASRYTTRPSFSKVVELPLPLAYAVEGLGIFETHSEPEIRKIVPSIAEGTKYEGREEEEFKTLEYQDDMFLMSKLGIPMKTIIPQTQAGNPWWTYKVLKITEKLNLQCTLPPSHYTEYSAHLRSVFLSNSVKNNEKQLIGFDEVKPIYGTMFRERDIGFNRLAFEAICHSPEEVWNLNSG